MCVYFIVENHKIHALNIRGKQVCQVLILIQFSVLLKGHLLTLLSFLMLTLRNLTKAEMGAQWLSSR